jgi:DNA-directed RNA polymerase subunit M/transcription elongation factor TFIIS
MADDFDRAEEWVRLRDVYAKMYDGELEAVAEEAYDLSEIALPLLKEEIARRKLPIQVRDAPLDATKKPAIDPADLELAVVAQVLDVTEARRLKGVLDEAGIPSYFGPDNLIDVDAYLGSYARAVELKVRAEDIRVASRAIAESSPPIEDAEFVCPQCKSPEIVLDEREEAQENEQAEDEAFHWSCDACGYQWSDDGIERQEST